MHRPLYAALRFLTRLPFPDPGPLNNQELGRVPLFYPVAGLIVGLNISLIQTLLNHYPTPLAAALLLMVWVGLVGILHLDGLADSADAWIGGLGSQERTLAIMKDPCSGPAGVTAITLILLLKFAALQTLLSNAPTLALLWPPLLARVALTALLLTTPYVRPGGMGEGVTRYLVPWEGALAVALPSLAAGWLLGWNGLGLLVIGVLGFIGLRWVMQRRIGGTTGDTAGALVEILETLLLITLAGTFN